ncbi:MAG: hypothetical protein NC225_08945 [Clostridium sp.]|nr:hypothetical protein [Clostridium sp.]MCM1399588.1 hypothetical protein [Clostridium sp.]MCM1460142.1 hypothetical protein [Bacteroides sp.]
MKKTIFILIVVCTVIYLILYLTGSGKDKGGDSLLLKDPVQPITIQYDVSAVGEVQLSSYISKDEYGYHYDTIEAVESEFPIAFLKPKVSEYDIGERHVTVSDGGNCYSIEYTIGRKRENTEGTYEYLTRVNGFITLTSVKEPVFPEGDTVSDESRKEYEDASRDYWDSLEYYHITMYVYKNTDSYDGIPLINSEYGNIFYNEEISNAAGINITVRGIDRIYDHTYKVYLDAMTNPYVPENYGDYTAYFADKNTIYVVNGKNDIDGFVRFLDAFGEVK